MEHDNILITIGDEEFAVPEPVANYINQLQRDVAALRKAAATAVRNNRRAA